MINGVYLRLMKLNRHYMYKNTDRILINEVSLEKIESYFVFLEYLKSIKNIKF